MTLDTELLDPMTYIPKYLRILTRADRSGQSHLVPMTLRPMQQYYIENRTHRDIVVKARQMGMTTGILAANAHKVFTEPFHRMGVVAHRADSSEFMLQTVHRFHNNLPNGMKPKEDWKSASRMRFPTLDSLIHIDSAQSAAIGRSESLTIVHLSELAFWPDERARELWAGISQTASVGAWMTLESSPRGRGGFFYQMYHAAKAGDNGFKPFFFPWWWEPDYQIPVREPLKYNEEESGLAKHFKLSQEQMAWRRVKQAELGELFYQEYPENDVDCVWPDALVVLEDGSKRPIQQLVTEHYDGKVMSVADDGSLVARKVIGWYRPPRRGRRCFRLSYRYGKQTRVHGETAARVTEDHKILTMRGWIEAKDITANDFIATGTPAPGRRSVQLILGSILGDACVTRRKWVVSHSNHEYSEWKAKLLRNFKPTVLTTKPHGHRLVYTQPFPYFESLRDTWYPDGAKRVDHLSCLALSDFGLAVWFMDDGSTRIRTSQCSAISEIACGVLPREDVEFLSCLLNSRGYACKVMPHNRKYLKIQFSAVGSERFLKSISRYVPPSMRYKLGHEQDPFEPEWYEPELVETFWAPAMVKEVVVPKQKGRWDKFAHLACLDVEETHNFVTVGGTVHNCWIGGDNNVFDGTVVRRYLRNTSPGRVEGDMITWKDPIGGHHYVIGVDAAGGLAKGDYSVAVVIDGRTCEHVATLRGKIAPDFFAEQVYRLGKKYNTALVAVEKMAHGHTVLNILLQHNYENLYHHRDYDVWQGKEISEPGWNTSSKTKPLMVDAMKAALRAGDFITYSENLLNEALAFQYVGSTPERMKMQAAAGETDDEIIAAMIALCVREQEPGALDDGLRYRAEVYAEI